MKCASYLGLVSVSIVQCVDDFLYRDGRDSGEDRTLPMTAAEDGEEETSVRTVGTRKHSHDGTHFCCRPIYDLGLLLAGQQVR